MMIRKILTVFILLLNTASLVVYIFWLTSASRVFYTQEGILYFLPCLPFFFVYLYFTPGSKKDNMSKEGKREDHD